MQLGREVLDILFNNAPSATTCTVLLQELEKQGDLRQAVRWGTKALQMFPQDLYLMRLMAQIYEKAGYIGLAEQALSRVASKLDDMASVYKSLAHVLATQKRTKEALHALEKYLAHIPDDQDALELKQRFTSVDEMGREEGTLAQGPPEAPSAQEQMEGLPEIPEPEKGPEFVKEEPEAHEPVQEDTVEEPPATELATPTLAEIYFSQGQIQDAVQIYEQYLSSHPEDHDAAKRLAELRALGEQKSPARDEELDHMLEKRQRTIAVLESWLSKIQELGRVQ